MTSLQSSSFSSTVNIQESPFASLSPAPIQSQPAQTLRPTPANPPSRLKARSIPASSFNTSAFGDTPQPLTLSPPPSQYPSQHPSTSFAPIQPSRPMTLGQNGSSSSYSASSSNGPNYNLALSPQQPAPQPSAALSFMSPPTIRPTPIGQSRQPSYNGLSSPSSTSFAAPSAAATPAPPQVMAPTVKPPPGWTPGLMQPTVKNKPAIPAVGKSMSWDDFDPLI